MRASVVINTYNRAASLQRTLQALRYQTFDNFEVIVVHGPSTDETQRVLADFAGAIRLAHCPAAHLSQSRNIGIAAASGDVVAFIDDDAIPEQGWLTELLAAYETDEVGGTGGIVFDHTGTALQYRYSVCNRVGESSFPAEPPGGDAARPGADPFVYLQGTNCSFRRDCLAAVGGFDEEIEYFLDEVEVALQVIDLGYTLRPLAGAAVHHKYLPSHLRGLHNKVVYNPFPSVKNLFYFALQNGRRSRSLEEVLAGLFKTVEWTRAGAEDYLAAGRFTCEQYAFFVSQLERGVEAGITRGLQQERRRRHIPPADPRNFRPFPVVQADGRRRAFCFLSQEYPPAEIGGIGRFTHDLAVGMAAQGQRVHVVTRSPDVHRVDFEDGVWVHRLPEEDRTPPDLQHVPLKHNLNLIARVYGEVCRIHAHNPLDVVSGPLWLCEGLLCTLDGRFATVLSLMTSMKTIAAIHTDSLPDRVHVEQLIALETATTNRAGYVHAISDAILAKVRAEQGLAARKTAVVPLGLRDHSPWYPRQRPDGDGRVCVLFVGRLERRKGIDLFVRAAVALAPLFPRAEFVVVGKDAPYGEGGSTYREAFARDFDDNPEVIRSIMFAGPATEEQLYQHYADADVVCMPSRFESFGLVLVEAMMFGKPVVACAVGGMREIVRDGVNGFLAAPQDVPALTAALRRLIEDEGLRREFGLRSRALFERHYTCEIMVRNTLACYEEIARDHGQTRAGSQAYSRGAVAESLAEVIQQAAGLLPQAARRYARCLLAPDATEEATQGPPGVWRKFCRRLVVLPLIGPLLRRGQRLARAVAPPRKGLVRLAERILARVPLVRKGCSYAKRLLLLPRTMSRLAEEVRDIRSGVDDLLIGQRTAVARLNELVTRGQGRPRVGPGISESARPKLPPAFPPSGEERLAS